MSITNHIIKAMGGTVRRGAMTRTADFATKGLIKEVPAGFANAYTGIAPTKLATGLFAAGAAAYAWGGSARGEIRSKVEQSRNDFVGTPPALAADGVANKSNAPTLGASGNLVFGLHNRR